MYALYLVALVLQLAVVLVGFPAQISQNYTRNWQQAHTSLLEWKYSSLYRRLRGSEKQKKLLNCIYLLVTRGYN